MEEEFIYWNHHTPIGIKIEEIFGESDKNVSLWQEIARQIYCDHGDTTREIGHFRNGAPFLYGSDSRISISHTGCFFVVASLPKTPEINLSDFNLRTAMGVDAESLKREQVLKLRERYLSEEELALVPEDDLQANILAWTAKEALYKAGMTTGLEFRRDIVLRKLPDLDRSVSGFPIERSRLGEAELLLSNDADNQEKVAMLLYSYESEGYAVTIAFSPKCARYGN